MVGSSGWEDGCLVAVSSFISPAGGSCVTTAGFSTGFVTIVSS